MSPTIRRTALLFVSLLTLGANAAAEAQPVSLSPDGIGQVLIYPYYTTRNGWTTLISIVNNDSANGKAVRVRFLEGKNGAPVASLNVFLAADDVWTGAVVAGSSEDQPATLVSNDGSCTWPNLRRQGTVTETGAAVPTPSLAFSNRAFIADGDAVALRAMDRTREGFIEVIEMASIPFNRLAQTPFTAQIYAGGNYYSPLAACTAVSDADLNRYANDISAPSGGLSGAATLVNVALGSSAEYSAFSLDKFWVGTASTTMSSSDSNLPNLASGGNLTAQISYDGKTYFSKFNRSIDAVSAALMSEQLLGEHAYTLDGVIGTTWVIATPTKRFYTQGTATAPFASAWDPNAGLACDGIVLTSFDRDAYPEPPHDDFSARPQAPPNQGLCFLADALSFGGVTRDGKELTFGAKNIYGAGYVGTQNKGNGAFSAGQEGGKTRLRPSSPLAQLTSVSGSIVSVDPLTGAVSVSAGQHTFYGLPMISVAFTQSSFKVGNPQQNFASGYRLQSMRRITSQ